MDTSRQARPGWLVWLPATCAAIVAVLLGVFSQAHWTHGKQPHAVETAKMVTGSALPHRTIDRRALDPEGSRERKEFVSNVHQNFRRRDRSQYRHTFNFLSYPPTRQEKLLVQFAQNAKPADLQMLNPEYQAKVEAQQEAEFAAYLKSSSKSNTQGTEDTNPSTQE